MLCCLLFLTSQSFFSLQTGFYPYMHGNSLMGSLMTCVLNPVVTCTVLPHDPSLLASNHWLLSFKHSSFYKSTMLVLPLPHEVPSVSPSTPGPTVGWLHSRLRKSPKKSHLVPYPLPPFICQGLHISLSSPNIFPNFSIVYLSDYVTSLCVKNFLIPIFSISVNSTINSSSQSKNPGVILHASLSFILPLPIYYLKSK